MSDYLNYIKQFISDDYLKEADLIINDNKAAGYDTILVVSPSNLYRNSVKNMFARIKVTGKNPYISFRTKYINYFRKLGIPVYEVKSDIGYFRINIDDFFCVNLLSKPDDTHSLSALMTLIFLDTLSFPSFGCCSKYTECSNANKCLHDDKLYATSCMYRKNLENGRIFYGKNKKIKRIQDKPTLLTQKIAVIDVETPNCNNDAICSIGITTIDENGCLKKFYTLINPETYFDISNTRIHGISMSDVVNSPKIPEVWNNIKDMICNSIVVGHNVKFDLSCIKKMLHRYQIEATVISYADTLDISRKVIDDINDYKLDTLCNYFDINLENHHNAMDDCFATTELFMFLMNYQNLDINEFIRNYDLNNLSAPKNTYKSIINSDITKCLQELNGILIGVTIDNELNDAEIYAVKKWLDNHQNLSGNFPFDRVYDSLEMVLEDNIITDEERDSLLSLFNGIINPTSINTSAKNNINFTEKKICLTGEFACMSKSEFSNFLEEHGAIIKSNVVKDLDYLVVGSLGSAQWIQGNYGTKIKKAMEWNEKGKNILIINENDFIESVGLNKADIF